jgi:hypothetical protein
MKKTNFFYHMLTALLLCGFMFCGSNNQDQPGSGVPLPDSLSNDSMNAAHHNDPSVAYPQPPVTGTTVDSSRSKDSGKKSGQ